jgi:predicted ester cyclase
LTLSHSAQRRCSGFDARLYTSDCFSACESSGFFAAFPDLQTTIEDLIAEGDKVAIRQTWRGTRNGNFLGIPPTGEQVTFTSTEFYRVAGGELAEEWVELDMLGWLQQLGAIPPMG